MKSRLAILLFTAIALFVICNGAQWNEPVYSYDSNGYYMYLPATFIRHDLKHVYLSDFDAVRDIKNKYPLGVALMQSPFFLAAHTYTTASGSFPPDGYSVPYRLAGIFSTLAYVIAGLVLLRSLLLRYFSDGVTAVSLLCIALGINLYTYTVFIPCMSHPYSFFLFAGVFYCANCMQRSTSARYYYFTALLLALSIITRPTNGIIAIIALPALSTTIEKISTGAIKKYQLLCAALIFCAVLSIQLGYWKYTTNHWLYYSYGGETFDFLHPKILPGLFSYRKGWLLYTPMAIACLLGLYPLWKADRRSAIAIIACITVGIYITFSWKNWWYGGGFSARPMIEFFAILAMPLAYLVQFSMAKGRVVAISFLTTIILLVALNMFQSYQFAIGTIHPDRMSEAYYWKVFGKTHINPADYEQYLMSEKEYWRINAELDQ